VRGVLEITRGAHSLSKLLLSTNKPEPLIKTSRLAAAGLLADRAHDVYYCVVFHRIKQQIN